SNLKTQDKYIKLAFITGVARFSKVSIFSDLNNLEDISFAPEYSAVCGVTSEELLTYFKEGIFELGAKLENNEEETVALLKKRYDGYHFSRTSPDIYNPFSLVNTFKREDPGSYWFESGTPTYLVTLLNRINRPFSDLAPVEMDRTELESAGLLDSNPVPVFYQSGYLTIRGYDRDTDSYLLDYPNEEVKEGFLKFLMKSYIPDMMPGSGFTMADFIRAVRDGRPEKFMESMDSLVADVPYSEKGSAEGHFQNAVYLLFTLLGFFARMERRTSDGRIDLTVETPRRAYVFEFKIDSSAGKAMEQIKKKEYWLPYAASGKEIYLIGANFDTRTRRLDGWVIEKMDM
ncbi:MAG: ATP-binding protein, partial [Muribaculaceae bacterium]|nr:ATP-binding protein [Muribaculaceae bacterium]